MTADIDNILKERSKEVVFTDKGYEDVDALLSAETGAEADTDAGERGKSVLKNVTCDGALTISKLWCLTVFVCFIEHRIMQYGM